MVASKVLDEAVPLGSMITFSIPDHFAALAFGVFG
jgi:hypothetical protein